MVSLSISLIRASDRGQRTHQSCVARERPRDWRRRQGEPRALRTCRKGMSVSASLPISATSQHICLVQLRRGSKGQVGGAVPIGNRFSNFTCPGRRAAPPACRGRLNRSHPPGRRATYLNEDTRPENRFLGLPNVRGSPKWRNGLSC